MFRNFIFTILTLYFISLSCLANDTSQIPSSTDFGDPEEAYYNHVLFWIDGDDIPDKVKQFAKQNNCIYVSKSYFWSNKKYAGGDVYSCTKNKKLKHILVKDNKMRFSHWYQKWKLNKPIYDH